MRKDPFDVIHHLSKEISKAAGLEEIYQIILGEIISLMDVERASIMRFDPKKGVLRIVAAKGIEEDIWKNLEIAVGEGVSGTVWSQKRPILIKKIQGIPGEGAPSKGSARYKTQSYMIAPVTCFPMKVGEQPIGLINVTDKKSKEPFTQADLKLLTTISEQVASYMHLYDLAGRLKEAEHAQSQLEIAKGIQDKLLPSTPPQVKGLDLSGCLIAAQRVGGDYYDFFPPQGDRFGVCIADVSGHSVGGALLAFAVRSCLRTQAKMGGRPGKIVEACNAILFSDLFQSEQFISLFYAHFESKNRAFTFTNAGHNPPLLWSAGKKEAQWLFTDDSLLGIEPNLSFKEKELTLYKGDFVVLYTDGLVEAADAKGERFGTKRLLQIVERSSEKNAKDLLDVLMAAWRKFIDAKPIQDDVTVVVLKATA